MHVKDIMTPQAEYITVNSSLADAAKKMAQLDCGFLPIADDQEQKLQGVITDRDIVTRAVAKGMDIENTKAESIKSDQVLYCFEGDSLEDAASSMKKQQVYRLIVLDDRDSKKLTGIVSLGDISRHGGEKLAGDTASGINAAA